MKQYPKIEYYNKGIFGQPIIAFDKLDGSNIRCEWSRKRGWYKFGTKGVLIDRNSERFSETIPLFLEKYGDSLPKVFVDRYKKVENFVVFSEYVGPNSFAGVHVPDDKMDIVLFDVNQYKRGFITPWEFVERFGHLDIPKIVYEGKFNEQLIEDVRQNKYGLKEGVIAKGLYKTKKDGEIIWQVKIKTLEWLSVIKSRLGEKALLEELNNDKELFMALNF
jgi:hypothetical protein